MKITGREAGRLLGDLGVDRESARRALLAGVAGPGERIGGLVLYESARVEELVALVGSAPEPDPRSLAPICRGGIFVARVGPRREESSPWRTWRGADMTAPMSEQLDAVRRWWHMSPYTRILFEARVERNGYLPFLVTVSGFVVLGADVVAIDPWRPEGTSFSLREPSRWFDPFRHSRLPVTQGGPWQLWSPEMAGARTAPALWGHYVGLTTIAP
jgi:hypothetical protein